MTACMPAYGGALNNKVNFRIASGAQPERKLINYVTVGSQAKHTVLSCSEDKRVNRQKLRRKKS